MSRLNKNTVDYFSHDCNSGRTMYIVENKYGNDGYALWFKTLELLGKTENHYLDLREIDDWEYYIAKIGTTEQKTGDILQTLSNLRAIDSFLWSKKIIWSYNFVQNLKKVYARRPNNKCMHFEDLCKHLRLKCQHKPSSDGINVDINSHSIVEYSKVKNSKVFKKEKKPDLLKSKSEDKNLLKTEKKNLLGGGGEIILSSGVVVDKDTLFSKIGELNIKTDKQEIRLAKYIWDKLRKVFPNNLTIKRAKVKRWSEDARHILETDKRDPTEIKKVFDAAMSDDFWKVNIQSPKGLRNNYDKAYERLILNPKVKEGYVTTEYLTGDE